MQRQPNTEYILSLSYGKDSLACLEAIRLLGYPLDRIVHAEVWATDTIPADLPPMVKFKERVDRWILENYGIQVEHICATRKSSLQSINVERATYENYFYTRYRSGKNNGKIYGFPSIRAPWCNSKLKVDAINSMPSKFKNIVHYIGIAADEPKRINKHTVEDKVFPLVDIGWDEAYCRQWCEDNDLLSPIYTSSARGGCWFCHNQTANQLRLLRKEYPELWNLLLKWDKDSPVTFQPRYRTVLDYEKRFKAEDEGLIKTGDKKFRWKQVL